MAAFLFDFLRIIFQHGALHMPYLRAIPHITLHIYAFVADHIAALKKEEVDTYPSNHGCPSSPESLFNYAVCVYVLV